MNNALIIFGFSMQRGNKIHDLRRMGFVESPDIIWRPHILELDLKQLTELGQLRRDVKGALDADDCDVFRRIE